MSGSFLSNFSFTVVLNLLIKLFWVFVIEIAVQNTLGAEVYGVYFESFNFSYVFFILLDIGLSNYTNRTVAGDPETLRDLFPSVWSIKLILTLVYLAVLFIAAKLMGYDSLHFKVVMFIGLNHVLMSMMLFFRSTIGGLHLFKTDAVISVTDRLIMGIVCAAFLWLPQIRENFSLDHYLLAMFIGYLGSFGIALWVVRRNGGKIRFFFDKDLFRDMLRKSYPFAILFFLMGLYTRIDSVMLGRLLDKGEFEVGIYASAFRLLDAAVIFAVLLSNLLLPLFSRLISRKESVDALVKESFHVVMIAAVLLPLTCYFYADYLYPLLYDENHAYGARVFAILFINFIPMAIGYIFGTLLTAKSELRLLNYISGVGLLVNIVLNAIFIPQWHALGAVYATILTQSLVTLSTFYFSIKYFRLSVYELINWRVVFFVLANVLVFYSLPKLGMDAPWSMLLSLLLGLIWIPVFRIIRISDLKKLIKSKSSTS